MSAVAEQPNYKIRFDGGGQVGHFLEKIEIFRELNAEVRILGNCYSACTLYTNLGDNFCAAPTSRLHFHAPFFMRGPGLREWHDDITTDLLELYPPKVRAFIAENGGLVKHKNTWLIAEGFEDFQKLGVRVCDMEVV